MHCAWGKLPRTIGQKAGINVVTPSPAAHHMTALLLRTLPIRNPLVHDALTSKSMPRIEIGIEKIEELA